ncbi:hypothetical protein EVAR_45711_1 [Eumeta japonica]|uniref:Histone-lysine N-methyltransferase SETMAR n=1 Tax=Eumeta variegata TaxID=151549 RepID=A0A4C1WZ85_EUMVA|nr:hypothetical protein EVAR_45711_1 [Eumeta japonica]
MKLLILEDRRIKRWEIARDVDISKERATEIIDEYLGTTKVSARWVPKMFTPFDRRRRVKCCESFLKISQGKKENFIYRIVISDDPIESEK